jgi:phosphate transport system permease protein
MQPRRKATGAQRAFSERTRGTLRRRAIVNRIMGGATVLCAVLATLPLVLVLAYIAIRGAGSINLDFFLKPPAPFGAEGGGMAHAIVGTLVLIGIASAIGLPIGVGAGLFLAEKRGGPLPTMVRFLSDVLNGLPSIVMGIFVWQFMVRPVRSFSALAGGVALAAIMIPLVTRTTEEMVRTVPISLREAALALGYSHWRTSLTVVLRTALAGIVTGILVATARVAGETAPLMFTAFGTPFVSTALDQPIHALPLQVFKYANTPSDNIQRLAWAGSLVLVALVLVVSIIARFATRSRFRGGGD